MADFGAEEREEGGAETKTFAALAYHDFGGSGEGDGRVVTHQDSAAKSTGCRI